MSHTYYNKQWTEAQSALDDMLVYEVPPDQQKPERDRVAAFQQLATMYIKYIQIFRKLEQCYDQIVHPQKRRVLRCVLDGVAGRVLELKNEMVNLEFSEYQYFDDVLSDLKLTPNDVEMPIPKYFVHERARALKEREEVLGRILASMEKTDDDKQEVQMSVDEAVRLIQIHERARQGRLRAKIMSDLRKTEERDRKAATRGAPTVDPTEAALKIQKLWRGVISRRKIDKQRHDEMMWLGMHPPPQPPNLKIAPQSKAARIEEMRRKTQLANEHEYHQALETVKSKIRDTEGADMRETMQDQIRQWFLECRDATGKFPDYPDEDEGGSKKLFAEKTPEELEQELKEKDDAGDKSAKGKKGKKGKKGSAKGKKGGKEKGKKKGGKKAKDDDEEEGWKMSESAFVPSVKQGTYTYDTVWRGRDETENFSQKHAVELIKEEKRNEVEDEIRIQVDELMRQELKNLKVAIDREKGKKGKKSGKKKKGKKGKKSGKKGKGKKGKKEKDLTPDRTLESLYEELVANGVIKKVPQFNLGDYEGEYSYLGTTLRQANIEPQPSLSDVRRLVTEFAILPLGSEQIRQNSTLIKSMLLTGPSGVGKKSLVYAICNATGANLFDLSATNIAGRYPGKDGLKMLLHLIFKVGRALQPSVFFIDDCDKMFKKKIPKTDLSDPKRLKKELPKAVKNIKQEDRIMIIGCSRTPFEAELKPYCALYQKIIMIPRPDYASRHLIWRRLIIRHGGVVSPSLDVSSLSKISDGYTMGQIDQACTMVLTERRVAALAKKPIQTAEFVNPMARLDPVYTEEETAFKEWYKKTPLGRKRAKNIADDEEIAGQGGNAGKGKKGKKGKGGKKGKKK